MLYRSVQARSLPLSSSAWRQRSQAWKTRCRTRTARSTSGREKLTASFNFEGALEIAAAAAALAQGREELVSGSDGTLPSWYRDPTKTGRDGSAKTIGFYRPKDQPKSPKVRYFLGITENNKDKQGNKIGISLEYPDLFKIARVMEEAALAILGWRKDIEGRREANGHDRAAKSKTCKQTAEAF